MAATLLSPEITRELALLRARAYGPDADISLDPVAVVRLIELEGWARSDAQPPASADDVTTEPPTAEHATVELPPLPPPSNSPSRRVPLSAVLAVAGVIGLGLGLAAPGLLLPQPDALLWVAPREGAVPSFTTHGVVAVEGSPTRYEPFRDLEVWSARMTDGNACVLVISGDRSWRAGGCAPAPLEPMAEVLPYPVIRTIEGLDLPTGSVVRFILREGSVQVWIDESAETG